MLYDRVFVRMLLTLGCSATALVLGLTLGLSFLIALGRALRRVGPENRRMEPGMVWLNLIPIFNLVWVTVTVERVAESLRNEFRERGMDGPDEHYGRRTGLTVLALLASGVLFYPAFITYPLALFFWIAYWRQINRYVERLKSGAYVAPPLDEGW
jgi:hypothetical protein